MMNRAKDRQAKNERGFTLVEVLIVAIIFSGIIISLSVLFLNGTTLQARALNKQLVFDDAAFIMERIVRDIVPSQIISADTGGACIDASLTDTLDLTSWVGHLHTGDDIQSGQNDQFKMVHHAPAVHGRTGSGNADRYFHKH